MSEIVDFGVNQIGAVKPPLFASWSIFKIL